MIELSLRGEWGVKVGVLGCGKHKWSHSQVCSMCISRVYMWHRVNWLNFCIEKTIETTTVWKQGKQQLDFNFQSMFDKIPENDGVPRGPNGEKLCCCKRIDGVCQEDPPRSNRCCKTVSINYIIMIFISVMGKNHFICPLAFRRF